MISTHPELLGVKKLWVETSNTIYGNSRLTGRFLNCDNFCEIFFGDFEMNNIPHCC